MTLIIKKIENGVKGIFTDRPFQTNDVVLKFQGKSLTAEQVEKLTKEQQGNVLQIGPDNFLNLEKETAFFTRHHCNPNCYIKAIVNNAFLISLRPIAKNEEITFDFSLSSTDDEKSWETDCNCHKYYCRKKISGFQTLTDEKKEEFKKKGIVPRYIKG